MINIQPLLITDKLHIIMAPYCLLGIQQSIVETIRGLFTDAPITVNVPPDHFKDAPVIVNTAPALFKAAPVIVNAPPCLINVKHSIVGVQQVG